MKSQLYNDFDTNLNNYNQFPGDPQPPAGLYPGEAPQYPAYPQYDLLPQVGLADVNVQGIQGVQMPGLETWQPQMYPIDQQQMYPQEQPQMYPIAEQQLFGQEQPQLPIGQPQLYPIEQPLLYPGGEQPQVWEQPPLYPQLEPQFQPQQDEDQSITLHYSPCNPSPAKLLYPPLATIPQPQPPCYDCPPEPPCYDCPPQPPCYDCQYIMPNPPCLDCPCVPVDPCSQPCFEPQPGA